jgi:hypothetical protein
MSIFVEKLSNFISFPEKLYFKFTLDPELSGSGMKRFVSDRS